MARGLQNADAAQRNVRDSRSDDPATIYGMQFQFNQAGQPFNLRLNLRMAHP